MNSLELLRRLSEAEVEFVLVGGLAATVHGSAYVTHDTDVCVPFTCENVERLLRAVGPLNPRQRMHPNRPPLSSNASDDDGLESLYL